MSKQDGSLEEADALRRENETLRARLSKLGDVETERRRLETLIETSPVGVLVVDAETRTIVSANQELERMVGVLPGPSITLERYRELVVYRKPDGRAFPVAELPLERALGKGETVRAEEIVFHLPDGRTVGTLMNATPIHSEDGKIVSAVAVIQDMTPREEADRLRSEFLGMVSHELRTPLTTIKGSTATVLADTSLFDPAETRQFFRIIDGQADLMRDLINNLLDLTHIEAGALSVAPEPTEVVYLVAEARSTFLWGGSRNGVEVDLAPNLPRIAADQQRVAQVLNNLLSNASKYSPDSSTIRVAASLQDGHVAISVTDEGRGVSADQMEGLFRPYSRVDGHDGQRRIAGDGLGLAICKGIVEAHGGRIWAQSDGEGRGSRFTFTIPAAREVASDTPDSGYEVREAKREESATILAIDDDPHLLRYVRHTLTEAGYTCMGTGNPDELVHFLDVKQPDLVLLDLVLPGVSGFDLMERIRKVSAAPVIFLSGYGGEEYIVQALRLGADDYIVKPFSPNELVARIEASLRKRVVFDHAEVHKPYRLGDLTIDYMEHGVTVSDTPVQLTATEYKLLFELSTNSGRVLTHDQILQRVWGPEYSGDAQLVRTFVKKVRRKLGEDGSDAKYILTQPRVGYMMAKPE